MSGSKISIALATAAPLVSVLFATPLGQAAGRVVIAQNSIGSKQVINGSLQTKDLSKKAVSALRGAQGPRGAQGVPGPHGIQGVQGVQGLPGTARTYGRIAADGSVSRFTGYRTVTTAGSTGGDVRSVDNELADQAFSSSSPDRTADCEGGSEPWLRPSFACEPVLAIELLRVGIGIEPGPGA